MAPHSLLSMCKEGDSSANKSSNVDEALSVGDLFKENDASHSFRGGRSPTKMRLDLCDRSFGAKPPSLASFFGKMIALCTCCHYGGSARGPWSGGNTCKQEEG